MRGLGEDWGDWDGEGVGLVEGDGLGITDGAGVAPGALGDQIAKSLAM